MAHHNVMPIVQIGASMNTCLILVDLQNDYFPGGSMELVGIEDAATNAQVLLHEFRKTKSPVIHVQHISDRLGATFFVPETNGAKIHQLVTPEEDEIVVVKNFPNSFRATPLLEILKKLNIDNLVICGAMSHMCIDATTRAAFDLGFNCIVADDACATKDLVFKSKTIKASDVHASFMAALSVPYAKVTSTKEIIESRA
jgi:nicotinamidase-related amidase